MKKKTALLLAVAMTVPTVASAYDSGYLDTTWSSAIEAADYQGMSFEEFKKNFALPDDLPEWESENTAFNNIPLYRFAPLVGFELEEYIEKSGVKGEFDENTPIGKFDDMTPLGNLWGENYDEACEYYSLTDVTKDTLYGEVRNITESYDAQVAAKESLSDVPATHWARFYIRRLFKYGYIEGYNDGTYKPEKTVTRAETAKLISSFVFPVLPENSVTFSDTPEDMWYTPYAKAVADYMPGENGKFMPEAEATRDDFVTAVIKSLGYDPDPDTNYIKDNFTDADSIKSENAGYITVALKLGVVDGYDDGKIGGRDSLTRAQAATILYRAYIDALEFPEYCTEVYATVGDYEITLGDVSYVFDSTAPVDASPEEKREALESTAARIVSAYKAYYVAELKDRAIDEQTIDVAISARQSDAVAHGGYSTFKEMLSLYNSDLDFVDSFYIAMMTQFSLGEEYDEDDYDKILKGKVEVTVNNDALDMIP